MKAPIEFVRWMAQNKFEDKKYNRQWLYHPRSDAHSVKICELILEDLINESKSIKEGIYSGNLAYGINLKHKWDDQGKPKTLDFALGVPFPEDIENFKTPNKVKRLKKVQIACEAKAVMTRITASEPRLFDELNSSHGIVHNSDARAIAAGITIVNIGSKFASPTNQERNAPIVFNSHTQPAQTKKMIGTLRRLPIRKDLRDVGFDAYASLVINTDNVSYVNLYEDFPAPQVGDSDHYNTFINNIIEAYQSNFE